MMEVDEEEAYQSQRKNMEPIAGTVTRIHMKNFMCHDNLEVVLNSRINFICGRNGSGKSAIQTAIAVGLGGRANTTNRGNSIKALIKNDKNTCNLMIELNNEGPGAYQPSKFGNRIHVERTFSHSSTQGYKIKNSIGKVVSTEKKELDRIISHFNIQTENPVCILHQDVARNFLGTSDPKVLFKFYMKAARLDDIQQMYMACRSQTNTIKALINAKYDALFETFKDFIEMKKKRKIMEEAKEKEEKRILLENELVWAKVSEQGLEVRRLTKKREEELRIKEKIESQLSRVEENSLKEKMSELEQKLVEIDGQAEDARGKIKDAKKNAQLKKDRLIDKFQELTETKRRLKLTKEKHEGCLREVEAHNRNAPEKKLRSEQIKAEIKERERLVESLSAAERSVQNDYQQLLYTVENNKELLTEKINRIQDIERRIRKKEDQLRQLRTRNPNGLALYGNAMVKIVDEINKAARRFSVKPVGPIGKHIKVQDPSWASAVEQYLGKGFLASFCVDNSQDLKTLSRILQSVCSQYKTNEPTIFCSKFLTKKHNIRDHETGTNRHPSLSQMLAIDDVVVFNCVVDQMDVQSVLLINTNQEAYDLLDEEHKVPRNCKKAFTKTSDLFIPAPNYKSYSNTRTQNHATLLEANQDDIVRQLKEEIKQLSSELSATEEERRKAQSQFNNTQQAVKSNEQEQRNLKRQKVQTENRLEELRTEEKVESQTNLLYFEEEAKELKEQLDRDEEKLQKLNYEREVLEKESRDADLVLQALQNAINKTDEAKAPLKTQIHQLQVNISEASRKTDILQEKLSQHQKDLSQIDKIMAKHSEELTQHENSASQMCDRVNTERSTEEINRELKTLNDYLQRLERENGGSLQTFEEGYKRNERRFNRMSHELEMFKVLIQDTADALKSRHKVELSLKQWTATSVRHHFQMYLSERKYQGKIEFDFDDETIALRISPPNQQNKELRTTSSLSGGEKSFSTVSFILALWSEIKLPFHFMDEFDVFMDGCNRRVVLDMLLEHALDKPQQFVFLTPLDMSSLRANEQVTIHRLESPRN